MPTEPRPDSLLRQVQEMTDELRALNSSHRTGYRHCLAVQRANESARKVADQLSGIVVHLRTSDPSDTPIEHIVAGKQRVCSELRRLANELEMEVIHETR